MYLEVVVVSFDATRQFDQPIFDADLTFSPTPMSTIFQEVRSAARSDLTFLSRWASRCSPLSLHLSSYAAENRLLYRARAKGYIDRFRLDEQIC